MTYHNKVKEDPFINCRYCPIGKIYILERRSGETIGCIFRNIPEKYLVEIFNMDRKDMYRKKQDTKARLSDIAKVEKSNPGLLRSEVRSDANCSKKIRKLQALTPEKLIGEVNRILAVIYQ